MAILSEQVAEIERCFRAGISETWAASKAGVAGTTVRRYYRGFASKNIPRGAYRRKPSRLHHGGRPPTPYTGPVMIGKRVPGSSLPVPIGPDWIGKAMFV